jgi:hypothetical protein
MLPAYSGSPALRKAISIKLPVPFEYRAAWTQAFKVWAEVTGVIAAA